MQKDKWLVDPKIVGLSKIVISHSLSFQTKHEDILNETWEISVLPLTVCTTTTLMLQEVHKEIIKLIQVNRAV